MSDIQKFDDFGKNRVDNYNKEDSYKPMSDDILALAKNDKGEFEKIKGKIDIVQITGIVPDDEIEEIKKSLKENATLDTSLTITDVKRGKELWLVALLKKANSTAWNAQQLGVIKVRVVDYFYGLNKLHSLKNNGKI